MAKSGSGQRTSAALIAAANYVKRRSRAILARGEDGVRPITAQQDSLVEWLEQAGKIIPATHCNQFQHFGGGAEHEVYFDLPNRLAIKSTKPNRFGWSATYEGAHATPLEYLVRLRYQNWFLGDDIDLVGAVVGDDYIEVVTSQPWISADQTRPPANEEQIVNYFAEKGFVKSNQASAGGLFYNPRFNVVAADAHSRNVLISVLGHVTPIDVVMGTPGPVLKEKLRREISLAANVESGATDTSNNVAVSITYRTD